MPSPVNSRPTPVRLFGRRVGAPVSSAHGRRHAQELNFLRAHAVQCVLEHESPLPHTVDPTEDVYAIYRRTPGVKALRLVARLHHADPDGTGGSLLVSMGTDPASLTDLVAADYLGISPAIYTDATPLPLPNAQLRGHEEHIAFIDVSALDPADYNVIRVRYTPDTPSVQDGLHTVSLHEVALPTVDPSADPTNEPGCNEAEADFRNRIYQGTSGGPGGLLRTWSELDVARAEVRRHVQLRAPATRDALAYGALDWGAGYGYDPTLRVRARKLYAAGSVNTVRFVAIYAYDPTYSTLTNSKIKVHVDTTNVGGASAYSYELQLTDTGGALAIGSVGAVLPTDGDDQIVEVTFEAKTSNTDGVSTTHDLAGFYALALIESET